MKDEYSSIAVGIGMGTAIGAAMDDVATGVAIGNRHWRRPGLSVVRRGG